MSFRKVQGSLSQGARNGGLRNTFNLKDMKASTALNILKYKGFRDYLDTNDLVILGSNSPQNWMVRRFNGFVSSNCRLRT